MRCVGIGIGSQQTQRSQGDGRKVLGLLPRLTLAASSLHPDSQPPGMPFEPAEFRSLLHLGEADGPSPSSPVTDVTTVPGAALLIFHAAFTVAELQAKGLEGAVRRA